MLADALYTHYTREPGPFQSRIAFVRKSAAGKDIWMADWDGHGAFPVAQGGLNILPAVTPDGAGVAFTSYRRGRPDLFAQRTGGAAQLLASAGQMATGAAYSPDGKQIAYSLANGESLADLGRRRGRFLAAPAHRHRPSPSTPAPPGLRTGSGWRSSPTGAARRRST